MIFAGVACGDQKDSELMGSQAEVTLITIDPGHFHAGLVQKFSQPQINDTVYVYAPEGEDLNQHLQRIESYNNHVQDKGMDFFVVKETSCTI